MITKCFYLTFAFIAFGFSLTYAQHLKADQSFSRRYLQYTEANDGQIKFNAILTRKAETSIWNGKAVQLITQRYQTEKGINTDSSFCSIGTLAPLLYKSKIVSENHEEEVLFRQDSIINRIKYPDRLKQFAVPSKNMFNGVIEDDLIAQLPLKLNKTFTLNLVNPGERHYEYTTRVEVTAREKIHINGLGAFDCWKLTVNTGGSMSLQWYTVDQHIQLIKKISLNNGKSFCRVIMAG